jgi:hypothetical protein
MTREVDWGDIKGSKDAAKTKSKTASNAAPVREVEWGDSHKDKPSDFGSWFQKNFAEPFKAQITGSPLETAGNLMKHYVNEPIERMGLPSAARGMFQGGENLIRGVGNIPADIFNIQPKNFPGTQQQIYPIPRTEMPGPQGQINPYVQEGAETLGNIGGSLPIGKGYQAIKTGLEHLPKAKLIPELIKNLIAGGSTGAALAPDDRGLGAGLGAGAEVIGGAGRGIKNFAANRNTGAKGREYLEAQLELERQKASEQSAKAVSKHNFGSNTPEALELSAKEKEQQFIENQKRQEKFGQEAKMLPGEQTVPEVEHTLARNEQALQQALGHGEPHSLQLSEHITNAIEGVPTIEPHPVTGYPREVKTGGRRKDIGGQFDTLADSLPETMNIPAKTDIKTLQKDYDQFIKDFPNASEFSKEQFMEAIKSQPGKGEEINPKAFFKAYRSMKQQEGALRSKARTFGTSIADADKLNEKADSLKNNYEKMQTIIEEHFPKETIKELHRINHEYATLVAPLNKNKVYINMKESGLVPGNILEKISGKQKGNSILRQMIAQDPELSRLALGHSYAEKPESLLKPNQTIERYIQANPQVAELLGLQRQSLANLETARANEMIVKQFENLPKQRAEFNRQRAMAKRLRDEAEVTGLSKAEVIKKKEDYEIAQRKLNKFIKHAIGTGIAGSATTYTLNKLLNP